MLLLADSDAAGRAYAAYGGVYIAASLLWLWVVEGASVPIDGTSRDRGRREVKIRPCEHVRYRQLSSKRTMERPETVRMIASLSCGSRSADGSMPRLAAKCPDQRAATNPPAMALRTTTSHGGVRHMNSSRKAAAARAKSAAPKIPAVQTG